MNKRLTSPENNSEHSVCAVVVTRNRLSRLKKCLDAIRRQTLQTDHILVVDNQSTDGTAEWLQTQDDIQCFTQTNLGSSGGFARGMTIGLELGAGWLWLMDDDGAPDPDALLELLRPEIIQQYDVVNSLVVREDDTERMSFGFDLGGQRIRSTTEARFSGSSLCGHINPFNGTLIRRSVAIRIGVPKIEMFIWGDEMEYLWRLKLAKVPFATVTRSIHRHPPSKKMEKQLWLLGTIIVPPAYALATHARNFGYLSVREKGIAYTFAKLLTYIIYYLSSCEPKKACVVAAYWIDGVSGVYWLPTSRKKSCTLYQAELLGAR